MVRAALLATLIAGALAAAGCGDDGPSAGAVAPAAAVPPVTASVERPDGRLGDATAVSPGRGAQALSPGGAFDLAERHDAPERDGVGAGAACANAEVAPGAATIAAVSEATLCLLNGERADQGLAPLAANDKLATAASAYAQDLVAGSYFSHTGRDGSDVLERIKRTGYVRDDRAWRIGENLAWGTGSLATPASIVRAWMNSPGHRANILNAHYREIGIGVVAGNPARPDGAGGTYATEFGAISEAAAPAAKAKKTRRAARKRNPRNSAKKARVARRERSGDEASGRGRSKGRSKGGKTRRVKGRGPIARIAI
jgi:uncharacterized protein YkwD